MPDILALLNCFTPDLSAATIRQLSHIMVAILTMSGRVTMLGMSRWTDKGGSYRSIQRFFARVIPWPQLFWAFLRAYLFNPDDVYLLVGDESVVTKAGATTYGLERFFSSLYGKAIPGVACFALSLVNSQKRQSYPLMVEQRVGSRAEKAEAKAKSKPKKSQEKTAKRPVGRPKGSPNKPQKPLELTAQLRFIQAIIQHVLNLIKGLLPLGYLVLDGHFGHNTALNMTRHDAAPYFPYDGAYGGRGRPHQ